MKAPYQAFGETRDVPVRLYSGGKLLPEGRDSWDSEVWIERGEDWYVFENPKYRDKVVRVVTPELWRNAE